MEKKLELVEETIAMLIADRIAGLDKEVFSENPIKKIIILRMRPPSEAKRIAYIPEENAVSNEPEHYVIYDYGLKEIIEFYHSDVISGKLNIKFLIVGDGGIYNELLNYVKEIGAKWVYMTGKVPFFEITEYIELADLCLMSFELNDVTKDITPVKIMEYMAMKKPVLSNSLPSVVGEIGENNGVIFARNQKELIKKIGELIGEKENLTKIGLQGYDLIKKYYFWPNILKKLKK